MSGPKFAGRDERQIDERRGLPAEHVFEVVRREGEAEMQRPAASLAWSGLAAGFAMGFSVLTEAVIRDLLPADAAWRPLVANMGYTVGFILVILSRLQLFTENTITPVLPVCYAPSAANLLALARLWLVVLAANVIGATLFAVYVMHAGAVPETVQAGILALGRHAVHGGFLVTVSQGIGAGFLVAALVWMLPSARGAELGVIFLVTYVIALAGFAHVVAGAVEMAALVTTGRLGVGEALLGFFVPALVGNVLGGTGLFTLIAYCQIRPEIDS